MIPLCNKDNAAWTNQWFAFFGLPPKKEEKNKSSAYFYVSLYSLNKMNVKPFMGTFNIFFSSAVTYFLSW